MKVTLLLDSNTTLVKVKLVQMAANKSSLSNSNTTLVKVKYTSIKGITTTQAEFKYNTC